MYMSIILAAGEGTRLKSSLSKVLHKVCGREIVKYVIDTTKEANIDKNVIVVGKNKEQLLECLNDKDILIAEQPVGKDVPYGTGYAVMCADKYINDEDTVIILCGDGPLLRGETLKSFINHHESGEYAASVLTCIVDNPTGLGRIVRDSNGDISKIVEHKDANEKELNISDINTGIYCINGKMLKDSLLKLDTNNSQNEYYITDTIKILCSQGYRVGAYTLEDENEIKAVNDRKQLADVTRTMRQRINDKHMKNGVTFINPDTTYVDYDVTIERDTTIYPNVFLEQGTYIGENCIIGPNSRIINSKVGNNVSIDNSKVIDSLINDGTSVGPFAYLRPGTKLGKNVKIGDFVEVKNSIINDNSKSSHLAYIGDAEIGKDVNIGCGVVFVNYDGKKKQKSIVKDNAFVGSNANLIAPVNINEGAYVACGSTITDDVEQNALAIARARQINKSGKGKGRYSK